MNQPIESKHLYDVNGNPAGGNTYGKGIDIDWQNGPLALPDGTRSEPNGAFVEGVLNAALDRLKFYQGEGKYAPTPGTDPEEGNGYPGRFRCRENALAITKIEEALHWLHHRTADREGRGVEGTHQT